MKLKILEDYIVLILVQEKIYQIIQEKNCLTLIKNFIASWHIFYWWSREQNQPLFVVARGEQDKDVLYISTKEDETDKNKCETIFEEDVEYI